jgi:formylglycine-generating enzyme required for sulfatase activity
MVITAVLGCGPGPAERPPAPGRSAAYAAEAAGTTVTTGKIVTNSIGMPLRHILAGRFVMGLPDVGYDTDIPPEVCPHSVRIKIPFYLGVHEVTQQEYQLVMGKNPSWHAPTGDRQQQFADDETARFPVEQVSWDDARAFCRGLSARADERSAGRVYRLPTEAEWEYACRSGKSVPYPFTRDPNHAKQTGENGGRMLAGIPITTVGTYQPNGFGLYDMRGNVFEWCNDWFARDYYARSPADDPQGPPAGYFKVFRGSDWPFAGDNCKLSRHPTEPWRTNRYVGFRVACDVAPVKRP